MAPKNDGKPWTGAERQVLRRLARDVNVSTEKIAKELGRTVAAIRNHASMPAGPWLPSAITRRCTTSRCARRSGRGRRAQNHRRVARGGRRSHSPGLLGTRIRSGGGTSVEPHRGIEPLSPSVDRRTS